jgi:hypothetical protein
VITGACITKPLVAAIQQAVDAAATKGIEVQVKLIETGFFSNERVDITVTAKPMTKEKT